MENSLEIMCITEYVKQLRKKEIGFFDIPEEHRQNPDIVKTERELGLRTSLQRGFDVVRNNFFVKETIATVNGAGKTVEKEISTTFSDFESYYNFLNGNIYENACYYQYSFTEEEIAAYNIDLSRINVSRFIDYTAASICAESNLKQYEAGEKEKSARKKWIARLNQCKTYRQFQTTINRIQAESSSRSDLKFYISNFIFNNKDTAFDIIMQYVSEACDDHLARVMCMIYDPQKVLAAYAYNFGTPQTKHKHKKKLQDFVRQLENGNIQYKASSCFDASTHFYRHQVRGYAEKYLAIEYSMYFETFQELASFLDHDLSDCDLWEAKLPDIDFSSYKTNERTVLPMQAQRDLICQTYKGYDRKSDRFVFQQRWINKNGAVVKYSEPLKFEYLFDFVHFLENDLSNADLLFCEGLLNMRDFSGIDLTGAKLHSRLLDKLDLPCQSVRWTTSNIKSFDYSSKNEEETVTALECRRDACDSLEVGANDQTIYYISDLHLLHRLDGKCKTEEDVRYELQIIIDTLLSDIKRYASTMLLVGGDTCSCFVLFEQFVKMLRRSIDRNHMSVQVVFILGNHELWCFPHSTFDEITRKYETVITDQNMHLIQNSLLYMEDRNNIYTISTQELIALQSTEIRDRLRRARIVIFGGLAFSGQNREFNANNGIYRNTISRRQEIEESRKFDSLYNIICNALPDRNVIILTHMPKKAWCPNEKLHSGFIYVSGHSHRNHFYDDGAYRDYSDNQVGYGHRTPHLKYFYVDGAYDTFADHNDGIYKITREQYIDFYHGKNIMMSFTRTIHTLYMLKKRGYYCFMHQSKDGNLTILNGGSMKSLAYPDVEYYYEKMEAVIARIRRPLDQFTDVQQQIANVIQRIGGSGEIHGAIIDIDDYNHIYLNPTDGTITGYCAADMIYKGIFPSVPKLLEATCPELYANYMEMLSRGSQTDIALLGSASADSDIPVQLYLDTDIYKASRVIKKMQRLYSNILSTWSEPTQPMLGQ